MTNITPTTDTQYLGQLAFNFAEKFGIGSFFILILFGCAISFAGLFLWFKFIRPKKEEAIDIEELKFYFKTLQNPTLEKINQILEKMKSNLSTEEVVIILTIIEGFIAYEITDVCRSLQNMSLSDAEIEKLFKEKAETIIRHIDRKLLRLPNISTAINSTDQRVESIQERSADFLLAIKNDQRYDSLKKSCTYLVDSIAVSKWNK